MIQEKRGTTNKLYLPDCRLNSFENAEQTTMMKDSSIVHDRSGNYECSGLNDSELLAFISGARLEKTADILKQYRLHEIEDYLDCMPSKMTTRQKAAIKATFELSRRIFGRPSEKQRFLTSPQDVVSFLECDMRYLKKEIFVCVHLNTKNLVLRKETVSIGCLNSSIVHPREVFANAVKHSASGIVLCHNHPSGNSEFSPEDVETTRRLVESGNILGIKVLDHVIIGNGNYVSFKERGLI